MSVSKENSSTVEVLESISRSVRVKPENLRLAEVFLSFKCSKMLKCLITARLPKIFPSLHKNISAL